MYRLPLSSLQIKYMCKDGYHLVNLLPILVAAHKRIRQYGSTAEDAGSESRNVKILLTSLLNKINGCEYSAQEAALNVLGASSWFCSHGFTTMPARSSVASAKKRQKELPPGVLHIMTPPVADAASINDPVVAQVTSDNPEEPSAAVPIMIDLDYNNNGNDVADDDVTRPEPEQMPFNTFTAPNGSVKLFSAQESYECRDVAFEDYSIYEYLAIVGLKRKSKGRKRRQSGPARRASIDDEAVQDDRVDNLDDADAEDGADISDDDGEEPAPRRESTAGRKPSFTSPLGEAHPLRDSHEQRILSKMLIPVMYGRVPRLPPSADVSATAQRQRDVFAAYVITLLYPWDLQYKCPLIPLNYESLRLWALNLNVSNSIIDRSRLRWIQILASAFVVPQDDLLIGLAWRARGVEPWTVSQKAAAEKKLAGAAKNSFVKKCTEDAKAAPAKK